MQAIKIIIKLIHAILLILLIWSCENEIILDDTVSNPKLIMNAFINTDSTNNVLYLNMSNSVIIADVEKAIVEVYVDNKLVETVSEIPPYNGFDHQKRYLITTKFNPGDLVRIEARTTDGKHHAWIEETVLKPPLPIEKVDTATVKVRIYDELYERLRFRITFTDKANETNYYRLVLERTFTAKTRSSNGVINTASNKFYSMLCNEDLALSDGQPPIDDNFLFERPENIYGVFSDNYINGQTYTLNVHMEPNEYPHIYDTEELIELQQDCLIRLQSISQTSFKYFKALNVIDSGSYDEMTMEPITFGSNVHGGLGLVSIISETTHQIKLPEQAIIIHSIFW